MTLYMSLAYSVFTEEKAMSKLNFLDLLEVFLTILFAIFVLASCAYMVYTGDYAMAMVIGLFVHSGYAFMRIFAIRHRPNKKEWSMILSLAGNSFTIIAAAGTFAEDEVGLIALPFLLAVLFYVAAYNLRQQWQDFLYHPCFDNWNHSNSFSELTPYLKENHMDLVSKRDGKLIEISGRPALQFPDGKEYFIAHSWDDGYIIIK